MQITFLDGLKGDALLEKGIAPRQRRVFILRWNPSKSPFARDAFENYFAQYKGEIEFDHDDPLDWSVYDWKSVTHRDLFVMLQVGQKVNGIVWGGYLSFYPYQYENEDGTLSSAHFFRTDVEYMHRIEKTGILTIDRLQKAVPEVDWLHGHSGEILSIESAEKLGLFLVEELKKIDASEDMFFDKYCEKRGVLSDIMTFMCTELKKRLKVAGRIENKRWRNIHDLMVKIEDENYEQWDNIEEHLSLEKLDGILM